MIMPFTQTTLLPESVHIRRRCSYHSTAPDSSFCDIFCRPPPSSTERFVHMIGHQCDTTSTRCAVCITGSPGTRRSACSTDGNGTHCWLHAVLRFLGCSGHRNGPRRMRIPRSCSRLARCALHTVQPNCACPQTSSLSAACQQL